MYYCGTDSTWASVTDLYDRYGDEFVDKLATRRIYDPDTGTYVADESEEGRLRVLSLALCDAKQLLRRKLSCYYSNTNLLDDNIFYGIKIWHIKLTIETLKAGGDCLSCACLPDIDKYIECGSICTEDGICLTSEKTFISASTAIFCCEMKGRGCGCC